MSNYVSFNTVKSKKSKKYIIATVCVLAALLVCVYIIGIIAIMNGDRGQEVSSAVSENVRLKQEMSERDAEIERLNTELASLRGELDTRPTPNPDPTVEPVPDDDTSESDYDYDYDYDDDEYISPRYGR